MHDLDLASDAQAVRRSLIDPRAFGVVFERHFDAVYGYARRRVGADVAEEIATEVFTRAFDRRKSFDPNRADARPWLLGIAANILRRHWRSERRRLNAYARAAAVAGPIDGAREPAEVVSALDSLSRDDRETLFLFAVADLTYEEIAEAFGIPVGTVRSRLARARSRMRTRLGAHEAVASHDPKESVNG